MFNATARALHERSTEELDHRIGRYRPRNIELSRWVVIRPFVIACAKDLGPCTWESAYRTLKILASLAAWATDDGLPLDREVVLDPDSVERFVQGLDRSDQSRATYRSVLRRVGPLLTKRAPWEPRPRSMSRRQVALPYTKTEVEQLRRAALHQPSAGRRRAARAILALGLGSGLDGRWVAQVRATDVVLMKGVVTVCVGDPSPRTVPVLACWEDEVAELAASAGDQFLVGGTSISKNRANDLTRWVVAPPGHPQLSGPRLRSTWLLWHLDAGTRLTELAMAAGLQGVTVLSDLLGLVAPLPGRDADLMLRGKPG